MKLNFCCVCGVTTNLHEHHIEPIVFSRVSRKRRTVRFDGNKVLKGCTFWEIFSYLFDIGIITEDATITACEFHHALLHGMIKFQITDGKRLAEEGRKRAKERGVKFGRPSTYNEETATKVLELRRSGMGIKAIGKQCSLGVGTVYKALKGTEFAAKPKPPKPKIVPEITPIVTPKKIGLELFTGKTPAKSFDHEPHIKIDIISDREVRRIRREQIHENMEKSRQRIDSLIEVSS
jgi:Helix-turn-helix domain of resolvase